MKKLILSLSMIAGLLAATHTFAAGNADRGAELVAGCAACHGESGNSVTPTFPSLAGNGEKYLLKQLQDIKAGRRAIVEMTGLLDALNDSQLADMAAFYAAQPASLAGAKEIEVQVNSGEKVDGLVLGEKVYRGGNLETSVPACTGCHSPSGQGNAPAGFPRLSGQHAEYTAKQLKDFRAGNRVNDGESKVMRQVAEHMSDAEIQAVANFIAGLN